MLLAVVAASVVSLTEYVKAERAAGIVRVEAAKSRQIAAFLSDMLSSVGPSVARGRDTTMLREILDRTAERVDAELGEQPEVEASLRRTVGLNYQELGEYAKGEKNLEAALSIHRELFEGASHEVATDLCNLGESYLSNTTSSDGEKLLRECLAMRIELFGERAPAVALARAALGDEHPQVAVSRADLASVLSKEARYEEARTELMTALPSYNKAMGEDHPGTGLLEGKIGKVLIKLKRYGEAAERLRKAVANLSRNYGEDNAKTLDAKKSLREALSKAASSGA